MNLFDQNDEELKKQILLRSLIGGDETSYNKPMIGNEQTAHVARGLSNAADLFVGRKPQFPVGGSSKLAEAMAIAKYKSELPKTSTPNYLLGEDGGVERLPDGRIVQRPFGLTDTAEKRYQGRLAESKANRDAGMVKSGFLPEGQVSEDDGQTQVDLGDKTYTLSDDLAAQQAEQEKRKKTIPDSDKDTLAALSNSVGVMGAIKDKAGPMRVSPTSLRYGTSPIANEYGKYVLTPEQSQFKSDLTDAVNQYLKAQTGVSRGFKEIAYLSSALPEGRQKPENFTANAEAVIGRSIMQMEHIVEALKKSGYDTSEFEADVQNNKRKYAEYVSRYSGQDMGANSSNYGVGVGKTQLTPEQQQARERLRQKHGV